MEHSAEIKGLILQWYEDMSSGKDIVALAEHLYSRQEGVLAVGTAPADRLDSFESIIHGYREMTRMGHMEIQAGNLKAYSEGTVGWAADSSTLKISDGTEIPVRQTFVFHKEDGEWKIVQSHASIGMADEEAGLGAA